MSEQQIQVENVNTWINEDGTYEISDLPQNNTYTVEYRGQKKTVDIGNQDATVETIEVGGIKGSFPELKEGTTVSIYKQDGIKIVVEQLDDKKEFQSILPKGQYYYCLEGDESHHEFTIDSIQEWKEVK